MTHKAVSKLNEAYFLGWLKGMTGITAFVIILAAALTYWGG